MEDIMSFSGEYRFLSNFYPAKVIYEGVEYRTSEHAYQAAKSLNRVVRASIQKIQKPGKAKEEGQLIKARPDWDKVKVKIMTEILLSKFSDPKLMEMLVATRPAILIEGNTWHDNFWGSCFCEKCSSIKGQNHLGIILYNIREGLYI